MYEKVLKIGQKHKHVEILFQTSVNQNVINRFLKLLCLNIIN